MGSTYLTGRLVVVLMLVTAAVAVPDQPQINFPEPTIDKWHIHVVNGLSDATLVAHCRSKDNDLGVKTLARGHETQWTFGENLWGTTLFWCFLQKPGATVSFDSFWVEKKNQWLHERCSWGNCIWTAKDDGIYLKNIPKFVDELIHKWVPSQL